MLELDDVVTIVKKISTAAVYLNFNNICHSNISSHTILIADRITNVKLSAFELALEFKQDKTKGDGDTAIKFNGTKFSACVTNGEDLPDCSMSSEQKIERYKQLSRAPLTREQSKRSYANADLRDIDPAVLAHSPAFRQYFCEYYYQAPELLPIDRHQLVDPSKQTDAYGVTLLLWELLNQCIPFVIYNEDKHKELLSAHYPLKFLPIIEEQRCQRFNEIFERGLKREPQTRIDLTKIIHKLNAIEVDIQVENDKQSRCEDTTATWPSGKGSMHRPPCRADTSKGSHTEKATPDRSISKISAILPSPLSLNSAEKNFSQGAAANSTAITNSSPLDYHKMLSPRREVNVNVYERTSTLKKRKKLTPSNRIKQSISQLLYDDGHDKTLKTTPDNEVADEDDGTPHVSSDFNNAQTKSAISRELSFTNDSVLSLEKSAKCFTHAEHKDAADNSQVVANWNQSLTDYSTLPTIARNNQIRRRNWLSSENVSRSQGHEPIVVAVSHLVKNRADANKSASPNGRKLNVSIKIVRSQLSPVASVNQDDSTKSDCSLPDDNDDISTDEESFSVKSRIKFFRSLESQSRRRSPPKNRDNLSRRSEITFNEARKVSERTQRLTYPQSTPTRQNLLETIPMLFADIQQNLDHSAASSAGHRNGIAALRAIFNVPDDDDERTTNSRDDGHGDDAERPSSVRETVQKIELSIRSDKSHSASFNRSSARNDSHKATAELCEVDSDIVADEKVEEVMHVHEPSDTENESGAMVVRSNSGLGVDGGSGELERTLSLLQTSSASFEPFSSPISENSAVQRQTLIKRTYYQEVICDPNASGQNATIATKSMTTRVTLNMRQCKRRASDVGFTSVRQNGLVNTSIQTSDRPISPHMNGVRHSISSPIRFENQVSEVLTTSGRQLAQLQNTATSQSTILQTKKVNMTKSKLFSSTCQSKFDKIH